MTLLGAAPEDAAVSAQPAESPPPEALVVGIQRVYAPWVAALAEGAFERRTGVDIIWRTFNAPEDLLEALTSGNIQLGLLGSPGVAIAMSTNLGVELFWIASVIEDAEALVIHPDAEVSRVEDLAGKRLGTPFHSTTHFHAMLALELAGLPPDAVTLVDLSPAGVASAWRRGELDAAFIWAPTLDLLLRDGEVLLTSGELAQRATPTFDGFVARAAFAQRHPAFMTAFVTTLAEGNARYVTAHAPWAGDSPQARAVAAVVGGVPEDVGPALARYRYPTLQEQASCAWLGCGAKGKAAQALNATARFLYEQGRIKRIRPDYAPFIASRFVEQAAQAKP